MAPSKKTKSPAKKPETKSQASSKQEMKKENAPKSSITDIFYADSDIPNNSFFTQTYYLFLILFLLHFIFTAYLFFKVVRLEKLINM